MGAGKLPHRDGMHTLDYVFIDFFYIDKMLNVGGVAVFDDTHFPSTRKVCRFILRNLQYRAIGPAAPANTGTLVEYRQTRRTSSLAKTFQSPTSTLVCREDATLQMIREDEIGDGPQFTRCWILVMLLDCCHQPTWKFSGRALIG